MLHLLYWIISLTVLDPVSVFFFLVMCERFGEASYMTG